MSTSESAAPAGAAPELRRCRAHPDVETGLSCGRCDTPICPRCMVMTPVGARCRDCARLRRLPTFEVGPRQYVAAAGAALAVAAVLGLLWSQLPLRGMAVLLPSAAVGLAAGEAVARAANRKRSRGLKAIAALAVPLAFWVSVWLPLLERMGAMGALLGPGIIAEVMVRTALAASLNLFTLLGLAFGAYLATTRIDR